MSEKLLSEVSGVFEVDSEYKVEVEKGDYLVVEVGFKSSKAGAKFQHPNIAATQKRIFNYKHYRQGGGKFWTSQAGVSRYLVIPRSAVTLLPEKGYSYVAAMINGVRVDFNVSGMGAGGWTDFLRTQTQISTNHKLEDFKKLCEVAVRGTPMEPLSLKAMEPGDEAEWERLAAKANSDVKAELYGMVSKGLKPVVKLMSGYFFDGKSEGQAVGLERSYRWKDLGDGRRDMLDDGRVKSVILDAGGYRVRAKVGNVDWAATAKANGIAA